LQLARASKRGSSCGTDFWCLSSTGSNRSVSIVERENTYRITNDARAQHAARATRHGTPTALRRRGRGRFDVGSVTEDERELRRELFGRPLIVAFYEGVLVSNRVCCRHDKRHRRQQPFVVAKGSLFALSVIGLQVKIQNVSYSVASNGSQCQSSSAEGSSRTGPRVEQSARGGAGVAAPER
jgi:hypothetical protein